jgi:hypothetical protein
VVIQPQPAVVVVPIHRQWYRPEPTLVIASAPAVYRSAPVVVASTVPVYSAMYTPAPVVVVEQTAVASAAPVQAAPADGVSVEGEVRFQYNR